MHAFWVKESPLTLAWTVALCLASQGPTPARAQEVVPGDGVAANARMADSPPRPALDPGILHEIEEPSEPVPPIPVTPEYPAPYAPARVVSGPLGVIRDSIFGPASTEGWHPLSLLTFFSEGWDEAYAKSPEGTNGAPKQNWLGVADGVFARLNSVNFFYTNSMTTNPGLLLTSLPWAPAKPKTNGSAYFASYNIYIPINQRLELLIVAPFVSANSTSPTGHFVTNFGDLTISERFRLIEQRNFSMQALLTERTATGQTVNGNNISFITPGVEFWWNFAPKWVVRGGTGINLDTGRTTATSVYFTNLAMGRYLTDKNARFFKEFVAHVSVSTESDVLGRKDYISDVYIGPGFRFGLDRDQKWYVIGAMQIPVSGPHPYGWQPDFALIRNY